MASAVLVAFFVVVLFLAPRELPWLFQRFVALTNALLVLLVVLFAFEPYYRRMRVGTADRWRKVLLIRALAIAGFLVTLAWWLSPAAPIKVADQPSAAVAPAE